MSYNIDNIKILEIYRELRILPETVKTLYDTYTDSMPESCFLDDEQCFTNENGPGLVINRLSWCGVGSGSSWETFINKVVPHITGSARIMVIWESGDTVETYDLIDGKMRLINSV